MPYTPLYASTTPSIRRIPSIFVRVVVGVDGEQGCFSIVYSQKGCHEQRWDPPMYILYQTLLKVIARYSTNTIVYNIF